MATTNLDGFLGKLEVTNEIGEALDKQLQQAEDQAQQLFGGCAALKVGANKVGELGIHIDKDLNEGKLQFDSELAAADYVKSYLRKAGEVLLNLADKAKSDELVAHGRAAAIRTSLELVGRHCKSAKARAEQLLSAAQEAEARGEVSAEDPEGEPRGHRSPRMPGEHPGPSPLDARRAQGTAPEEAPSSAPSPAGKTTKKRKCSTCGKTGHTARTCPKKGK